MCGISFVLDRSPSQETLALLSRMHAPIRHRGPDGEGYLVVDAEWRTHRFEDPKECSVPARAAMAFRRLKILDLSEDAAQPMCSDDGTLWIVFNGEIYNFRELRAELAAMGHRFRTAGDTEVILGAYAQWGEGCFSRLDGMWAIVIADLRKGRVVASRDRFGIKPLYWIVRDGRFFLASEIKQLVAAGPGRPRAHAPLVRMHLEGTRYPSLHETFFEGIRSVPQACWFELPIDGAHAAKPEFHSYWDLAAFHPETNGAPRSTYETARERFRELLVNAVSSHAISDVALGCLLSGGIDSSVIAALLVPQRSAEGKRTPTFSFGFREAAPEVCEMMYVDTMVRASRFENYETTFDPAWILTNMSSFIRTLEEPAFGLPVMAQYRLFQLCRERGVTVVLDGQGADEILGGYPYYQRLLVLDRLRKGRWRVAARELRAIARRGAKSSGMLLAEYLAPSLRRRLSPGGSPSEWISQEYGMRIDAREMLDAMADRGTGRSLVDRQLHWDVRWGNVKLILNYADRNAMAFSIEARVPYFDRRLVEFAFSLPDEFKVGEGDRKRILRDVARDMLPPALTERRDRMGFGTPDRVMIRGALWPAIKETILSDDILSLQCISKKGLERFVSEFEHERNDDVRAIWRLWTLARWQEEFRVTI